MCETRRDQLVQPAVKFRFWQLRCSRKQPVRELTPDHCTDLCYLLCRRQPVQPRHQRGLQRGRNHRRAPRLFR